MPQYIYPPPGTTVYMAYLGLVFHKGIVSDCWWNDKPMIIDNSLRFGVAERPWDTFAAGQTVYIQEYPQLPASVVLCRARRMIGIPYNLFSFNCEHFVKICYGQRVESPQVAAALYAAVAFGFLALAVQG